MSTGNQKRYQNAGDPAQSIGMDHPGTTHTRCLSHSQYFPRVEISKPNQKNNNFATWYGKKHAGAIFTIRDSLDVQKWKQGFKRIRKVFGKRLKAFESVQEWKKMFRSTKQPFRSCFQVRNGEIEQFQLWC